MRRRLLLVLVIVAAVGLPRARAAADPVARCEAAKLAALGRYAAASARCDTPAHGTSPDAACLAKVRGRLAAAFVQAGAKGPCPAGADVAQVQSHVDDGLGSVGGALLLGAPCSDAKLRAAGRYGSALLKARARNLLRPDDARRVARDAAARARLDAAFTAAEPCRTSGDAGFVAVLVGGLVVDVTALAQGNPPPTLRSVVQASGRWVGSAVRIGPLTGEPQYAEVLAREFDYLTAENDGDWYAVHPAPDVWNWEALDQIVDFAGTHGMHVKIGGLLWWLFLPDYVMALSPDDLRAAAEEWVRTTVARYRGRVAVYDVVNEPFLGGTTLLSSVFLQKLGAGYIADALRWAREEDPDALLFLNDFGIEDLGPGSDTLYAFAQQLLADGVPLDGVGFEMHVGLTPEPVHLRENIARFAALGLRVGISELDVQIAHLPGDLPTRLATQAATYGRIAAACAAEPGCFAVNTWGFTDKYSWIDSFFGPDDPLPLDELYRPKPAYFALRSALGGG